MELSNLVKKKRECKQTKKYKNIFHINDSNATLDVPKTRKRITLSLLVQNMEKFKPNTFF